MMGRLVAALLLQTAYLPLGEGISPKYCPLFHSASETPAHCVEDVPRTFLGDASLERDELRLNGSDIDIEALKYAFEAVTVMQTEFFTPDRGIWPEAIDWTAAVLGTSLGGLLSSLSEAFGAINLIHGDGNKAESNLVDVLFSQLIGSYLGQDDLAIRHEAYDDMLWVVLGWIGAIEFVHLHSHLHYPPRDPQQTIHLDLAEALRSSPWHGHYWVPSFAHRARLFWESASRGWDDNLCKGGMVWNPRLGPYKNAVTNELWISASISMYLWFPGDNNTSPWVNGHYNLSSTRDPKFLAAAVEGYNWLMGINMTNPAGLFIDGYHIDRSKRGNTRCDVRNEMVYTYNQGIILTGQRGLWTATGSASYLEDGHQLIQSVIKATGWDFKQNGPMDDLSRLPEGHLPPWRGLGRGGILEEQCDASGTCSQDGQAFKGIFFHHLTTFCAAIETPLTNSDMVLDTRSYGRVKTAHAVACKFYSKWVQHNAKAALATRDEKGRFGSWWGAGLYGSWILRSIDDDGVPRDVPNAEDYRNYGIPHKAPWLHNNPNGIWAPNGEAHDPVSKSSTLMQPEEGDQAVLEPSDNGGKSNVMTQPRPPHHEPEGKLNSRDPNNRGRGRTVEAQNGGLALMRAWWELVANAHDLHPHDD